MKLTRIDLHGYKSFASRAPFIFHDGITAIVGPNGSGKSNIADAIQWVLGEQSFSMLRAKKTEDMIFAGSSSRPRMGMAEVSLTLDNSTQWLPIEFSEVTVARRAYRSGENDYLINGAKVRWRDVVELLAKGGLGRGSYTVIGQGLIDSAISLRPEERRALLEDAAGITIFQTKKADALAKLAATQENLIRVADILQELGPRVRRLREQANRANQFQEVQHALAERLQIWYGYQWIRTRVQMADAERAVERMQADVAGVRARLQTADAARAELRDKIQSRRREISAWQRTLGEQQSLQQKLAQQHDIARERLSLLTAQRSELLTELQALDAEHVAASRLHLDLSAEIDGVRSREALAAEQLNELQRRQSARAETQRLARASQLEARRAALDLSQALAERMQSLAASRERVRLLAGQVEQYRQMATGRTAAAQSVAERLTAARAQLDVLSGHLADIELQAERGQQHRTGVQASASALREYLARSEEQLRKARGELELAKGRAIGDLLDAARELHVELAGPLHALCESEARYHHLVRGALGRYADAVVVASWEDARTLATRARSQHTILVLQSFYGDSRAAAHPAGHGGNGAPTSAFDLISCDPLHRPLFQSLLGPIHLDHGGIPRVSLDGDLITRHALVTADRAAPSVAAIEESLREQEATMQSLSERLDEVRAEETRLLALSDSLSSTKRELESSRMRAQAECGRLIVEHQRLSEQAQEFVDQASVLEQEQTALMSTVEELEVEVASIQQKQRDLSSATDPHDGDDDDVELNRQLARQETHSALLHQDLLSRQQSAVQAAERAERISKRRSVKAQQADSAGIQIGALREQIASLAEQTASVAAALDAEQERLQETFAALEADEERLRDLEGLEAADREALYAAEAAHSQALVEVQRRQDREGALREQIENDYEYVSLETNLAKTLYLDLGDRRASLPEPPALPEGHEAETKSFRNKMRWIGHVNLEAPAEYRQEKERFEFLSTQSADLKRASESLSVLIQELDALMQQRLRDTFDGVARAFKVYFTRLFAGGSAELVLTDPANLTSTGIDIIAHPPGKRRQPLSLLSGGERALTACALTFALLKTSPTPFCVLDEVDAALDEANIGRFRDTLKELAETMQFVVVTHNRGTVEAAGSVYGISMAADGVSQVLSLRLNGAISHEP